MQVCQLFRRFRVDCLVHARIFAIVMETQRDTFNRSTAEGGFSEFVKNYGPDNSFIQNSFLAPKALGIRHKSILFSVRIFKS